LTAKKFDLQQMSWKNTQDPEKPKSIYSGMILVIYL